MAGEQKRIRFCPQCGAEVEYRIPDMDNRERACCPACEHIEYQNPIVVVGSVPIASDGRILICKRAIEPRRDYWTLPAGFLELGETLEEGAAREAKEEANIDIQIEHAMVATCLPQIGQIHWYFVSKMLHDGHSPGEESLETKLVTPDEIPWDNLAFLVVRDALKTYLKRDNSVAHPMINNELRWKRS